MLVLSLNCFYPRVLLLHVRINYARLTYDYYRDAFGVWTPSSCDFDSRRDLRLWSNIIECKGGVPDLLCSDCWGHRSEFSCQQCKVR